MNLPDVMSPSGGRDQEEEEEGEDTELESSVIIKSHFDDSFEESASESTADVTLVPSYINVERKVPQSHNKAELSDSDIIDPEILKPKKKKGLPEPPSKPNHHGDNGAAAGDETVPLCPETVAAEVLKTNAQVSHQYDTCGTRLVGATPPSFSSGGTTHPETGAPQMTRQRSGSNSTQPPHYDSCVHKGVDVTTPPCNKVNISARYETAFLHHMVTVPAKPDQDSTAACNPPHEYAKLDSTHDYANLEFAMASKNLMGQQQSLPNKAVVAAGSSKKSPSLPKKPVPIQRKQNSKSEAEDEDVTSLSASAVAVDANKRPVLGRTISNTPKKPLPPAKPARLLTGDNSGSSVTSASSVALSASAAKENDTSKSKEGNTSPSVKTKGGSTSPSTKPKQGGINIPMVPAAKRLAPLSSSPPTWKPRPLSSDFAELSVEVPSKEDELASSIDSIFPLIKPRSYTCAGVRPELRKQPLLPPPPPFPSSGSSSGLVVVGQIIAGCNATPSLPSLSHSHHAGHTQLEGSQTATPTTSILPEPRLLPQKPNSASKPMLPSRGKGFGPSVQTTDPLVSGAAAANLVTVEKSVGVSNSTGKITPPPKPSRVNLGKISSSVSSASRGNRLEEDTAPKDREELMRKLSLRRLRIEEQLASTRITSPTTNPTLLGGGTKSSEAIAESASERNSGLSSSSSLSEVVVAYHARKVEGGAGGIGGPGTTSSTTSLGSSETSGSGGCVVTDGPGMIRREVEQEDDSVKKGDENLVKYGIIEDVGGGSYII